MPVATISQYHGIQHLIFTLNEAMLLLLCVLFALKLADDISENRFSCGSANLGVL